MIRNSEAMTVFRMPFSWDECGTDARAPVCRLFLSQRVQSKSHCSKEHSHPFWQSEIVLTGRITVRSDGNIYALRKGSVIFIPSDKAHEFAATNATWITMRFLVEGWTGETSKVIVVPALGETVKIRRAIMSFFDLDRPHLSENRRMAIEAMISALLCGSQLSDNNPPAPRNPIARGVLEILQQSQGKRVTLSNIADKLGYSANHVTTTFRQSTGRTLKSYIDIHRHEAAMRLLTFTNMQISQIALELGFADIYSFCRFFKRHAGQSPTAYRKWALRQIRGEIARRSL